MKILVLGGTGVIGCELIKQPSLKNHELFVTTRRSKAPVKNIHFIQGDAQNEVFVRQLMRQCWDVIVDFMVYNTESFRRRIEFYLGATNQYVFTSSARVFAASPHRLTECSPRLLDASKDSIYLSTDEYALTKARQEDLLRGSASKNWTIIRPYITFGEGRLQLGTFEKEAWLYRALNGRSIVFCEDLLSKYTTMTDASDVARMITVLLGNPDTFGEDYNLTEISANTWGEVLDLYLEELESHLGKRPNVVLQRVTSFCHLIDSVPQLIYDRMYDRRFDPSKISRLFDVGSLRDNLSALRVRTRSQLKHITFRQLDWRGEAVRDSIAGEFTALKQITTLRAKLLYALYRHSPLKRSGR